MVSTHSQYITDFTPTSSVEPGKSPLAMLAKTCETIGLPDTPSKKSPSEKKDDVKKADSPSDRKKERSPRATPTATRVDPVTSTTFPGLPKPTFPLGFSPGLAFPFPYPMMPYTMSFPSFPMPFSVARPPCPSMLMQRPCVTPGCTSCSSDMLSSFAAHPLFSTYSSMMPSPSSTSMLPASYQSLLATSAGPSASTIPSTSAASAATASKSSTHGKHMCSWVETTGICGKQFATADELAMHVKQLHTPSPPSSAPSAAPEVSKTPLSRNSLPRFHPYSKPTTLPMPPMMPFPSALQAMYAQRIMSTMPHP
ncbi:hypothetical protein V3C99_008452 [Haemonchus contortus]|nr:zinc finger protein [Haemonchus contortus]